MKFLVSILIALCPFIALGSYVSGAGGGSGNLTPNSSTIVGGSSGRILFHNSNGKLDESGSNFTYDPTAANGNGQIVVPNGEFTDDPVYTGCTPGILFPGSRGHSVGIGYWDATNHSNPNQTAMVFCHDGNLMAWIYHDTKDPESYRFKFATTISPTSGRSDLDNGEPTAPWNNFYGRRVLFTSNIARTDVIWMNGASGLGTMAIDASGRDPLGGIGFSGSGQLDYIFFTSDGTTAKWKLDPNSTANSTKASSLFLEPSSKTAGTGDGGDLVLAPGTSAGGNRGHVNATPCLASPPTDTPTAHSPYVPVCRDTTLHKTCWYEGGSWSCS